MSDPTVRRAVMIRNEQGLHMRPAEKFVRTAATFESKIELVRGSLRVDGKSMLDVFTLAAEKNTELILEATGHDAEAAVAALAELLEGDFSEPEPSEPEQADQK